MILQTLDRFEEEAIAAFRRQPAFARLRTMEREKQDAVLLQRRFLSLEFTKVFDLLIDGLEDEDARICARQILREEYPDQRGRLPSHRENLFSDLLRLGIPREAIFAVPATIATTSAAVDTLHFVREILVSPSRRQLRSMAMLRFWGEVLTAAEYFEFWEAFLDARFSAWATEHGVPKERASSFYDDHIIHDQRRYSFATLPTHMRLSHADRMAAIILRHIETPHDAELVQQIDTTCIQLKSSFYAQFA